jgi:hypothetical protein
MADPKKTTAAPKANSKTPRERMTSVGVSRVNNVIHALSILENCADRAAYEYSEAEYKKIKATIDAAVAKLDKRFSDALAGKSTKVVKQGFGL